MQQQSPRQLTEAPCHGPLVRDLNDLVTVLCSEPEGICHVEDVYTALRQYNQFSNKALAQAAYLS